MSARTRSLAILAAATTIVALSTVLASRGAEGAPTLDERVHEIAAGLRCPVCQNLSVADSPSRLAGEMRSEIEGQLHAGRSPGQIRAFFVDRYGEWVLLAPPRRGLNLIPWLVPVAGLAIGAWLWAVTVRRRDDLAGSG